MLCIFLILTPIALNRDSAPVPTDSFKHVPTSNIIHPTEKIDLINANARRQKNTPRIERHLVYEKYLCTRLYDLLH